MLALVSGNTLIFTVMRFPLVKHLVGVFKLAVVGIPILCSGTKFDLVLITRPSAVAVLLLMYPGTGDMGPNMVNSGH